MEETLKETAPLSEDGTQAVGPTEKTADGGKSAEDPKVTQRQIEAYKASLRSEISVMELVTKRNALQITEMEQFIQKHKLHSQVSEIQRIQRAEKV